MGRRWHEGHWLLPYPTHFHLTHATASDTNAERGYIINELSKSGAIENVTLYKAGDKLLTKHVNHYLTDGEIAVAELTAMQPA